MALMYRHDHGETFATALRLDASVSVELPTADGHAVLKFEDEAGALHVTLAREVFPRLVEMIHFAGLADGSAARRVRRRLSPSDGALPGLVVRKTPGDGDGA